MLKIANQSVIFFLELVMLGSLSYFGYLKGSGHLAKFFMAIIFPVMAILLWSHWAAPKSIHRLEMPYLAIFRLSLFWIASYLLYACGHTRLALIVTIIALITQVASIFLESNGFDKG